jgi:hypothetical protein
MTDFQNWWDGYFHEINGQKETAQAAWQARGELDAVRIKEWQDIASKYAIYEEQADVKIAELTAKLDKAKEALEFECGGRCNAEYNPCNAREVLKELDK